MEDIEDLLNGWGLPHLVPHFRDQRITKATLLRLNEEQMSVLSPYLGDQLILWDEIKKANAALASTSSISQCIGNKASTSRINEASTSLSNEASTSQSEPSSALKRKFMLGHVAASKKIACVSNFKFVEDLDVEQLLLGDNTGKIILASFNDCEDELQSLSERQRDALVGIIINHIKDNTTDFKYQLLSTVATKICQLFPSELEKTYFQAPKTDGPQQVSAKGKLFNKLKNSKSKDKSLSCTSNQTTTSIRPRGSATSCLSEILKQPITEEALGAEVWLTCNRSPWVKVIEKWGLTAPIRFKRLFITDKKFSNEYIGDWNVLGHKSGFELLTSDFDLLFPGLTDSLFTRWSLFYSKTVALGQKDIKDPPGKELLQILENCEQSNSRGRNLLMIALLAYIRPNHRHQEIGKVSAQSARNSYLLHLTSGVELRKAIKQHRDENIRTELGSGQPLIVAVGPTLSLTNKIYVSIAEDLLYEVPCPMLALDICFKSFFTLHMSFPAASSHIWTTIQRVLYSLKTEWDSPSDVRESWINFYKF